jgi:pentatricopeptide repeat protein
MQAREPSRAVLAYKAINEDGKTANCVTTCILIHGLLAGPRKRAAVVLPIALALWDDLKLDAARSKSRLEVGTLETGLHVCCRGGRMSEAAGILEQMRQPKISSYNMMIRGYGKVRDIAAAVSMLEKMTLRSLRPNCESYNALVSGMCEVGEAEGARAMIDVAARQQASVDEWAWSALLQVRAAQLKCLLLLVVSEDMKTSSS